MDDVGLELLDVIAEIPEAAEIAGVEGHIQPRDRPYEVLFLTLVVQGSKVCG